MALPYSQVYFSCLTSFIHSGFFATVFVAKPLFGRKIVAPQESQWEATSNLLLSTNVNNAFIPPARNGKKTKTRRRGRAVHPRLREHSI
jgi:hypothetical protein